MQFDIAPIIHLLKHPTDFPAAAKAMGVDQRTVKMPGVDPNISGATLLREAVERIVRAATSVDSEVIELSGAPAMLKGQRVRILAVLEPATQKVTAPDAQTVITTEEQARRRGNGK